MEAITWTQLGIHTKRMIYILGSRPTEPDDTFRCSRRHPKRAWVLQSAACTDQGCSRVRLYQTYQRAPCDLHRWPARDRPSRIRLGYRCPRCFGLLVPSRAWNIQLDKKYHNQIAVLNYPRLSDSGDVRNCFVVSSKGVGQKYTMHQTRRKGEYEGIRGHF
jgi:hypothetical protein